MISNYMYQILKLLPHAPATITFEELYVLFKVSHIRLIDILKEAERHRYVEILFFQPKEDMLLSDLSLTEAGQTAIEEYEQQKKTSTRANLAIVISILSLIIAAITLFLKF